MIERRRVGASDIFVSRIGLGGWQASGWETSHAASYEQVVHEAIDRGVNLFDTAPSYGKGEAERLLGKAIGAKRESVIIATKFGPKDSTPKRLRDSLEQSLKNLNTDYIDIYQQHWPPSTPAVDETLGELLKLRDEGKIREIGVSNWGPREFSEVSNASPIMAVQGAYSLLWRRAEKEIFPWCKTEQVAFFAYSPLCQGVLTGKFKSNENLPRDSRRQNIFLQDKLYPEVKSFLSALSDAARGTDGFSMAQVALGWILAQPPVTSVLVGCSRLSQLLEACTIGGDSISQQTELYLSEQSEHFIPLTQLYPSLWNWHPRGAV